MTNLKVTPSESILVAIDVSKSRNDILIDIPGASRQRWCRLFEQIFRVDKWSLLPG